jgi:hypothetical protein
VNPATSAPTGTATVSSDAKMAAVIALGGVDFANRHFFYHSHLPLWFSYPNNGP